MKNISYLFYALLLLVFGACSPKNQSYKPTESAATAAIAPQDLGNDATAGQIVPFSVRQPLGKTWQNATATTETSPVLVAKASEMNAALASKKLTAKQRKMVQAAFNKLPKSQQKLLITRADKNKSDLKPGKTIGILSMAFGALGWLVPYVGILLIAAAIVLGIIGLKTEGKTFAIIGLVLGVLTLLLYVFIIGAILSLASAS